MEIKTNITVKLSEEDVKHMIAEYVSKKIGYVVSKNDVEFFIGSKSIGYGIGGEYKVDCIKCVQVSYKED